MEKEIMENIMQMVGFIIGGLMIIILMYLYDMITYVLYLKKRKIYDKLFKMPPMKVLDEKERIKQVMEIMNEIDYYRYLPDGVSLEE